MNAGIAGFFGSCALLVATAIGGFGCARSVTRTNGLSGPASEPFGPMGTATQGLTSESDVALVQGSDFGGGFTLVAHPTLPLIIRGNDSDLLIQDTRTAAIQAVLPGALAELRAITLSPDGRAVYTGDVSGELAVWELATGQRSSLGNEPGPLFEIACDPGGPAFVTSGREYTHYYPTAGAQPRPLFAAALGQIRLVMGGKLLVGRDPSLKVIDVATGAIIASANGGSRWNPSWALGPSGNQVVWIGPDDTLLMAELPRLVSPRRLAQIPGANYLYWSADGTHLLVDASKQVVLLDREGRTLMNYPQARASVIGFSPSGQLFALQYKRRLAIHDSRTGSLVKDFPLDGSPGDITWCGDDSCLGASQGRGMDILSLRSGAVIRAASPQRRISDITFHPGGRLVDLAEHFAGHHLIDLLAGREIETFPVPFLLHESDAIDDLAFSPNGTHYAAGTPGVLDVVNLGNGVHRRLIEDPSYYCGREARFSPDGYRILVLGNRTGAAFISDVATGRELLRFTPQRRDNYFHGEWSPRGDYVALAGRNTLQVVNSMTGAVALDTEIPSLAMGLSWLDPERLLSGHDGGELLVWSLRAGPRAQAIEGVRRHVNRIAVSSDGRWAAAIVGRYHVVDLINAATLRVVRQLRIPSGEVTDLQWHPCYPLLGVAHGDATFFDVEAGTWLRVALLGEEESPKPPSIVITRSDGHVGGTVTGMPFVWVRHGWPLGPITPVSQRPELMTAEIGQPWFAGCQRPIPAFPSVEMRAFCRIDEDCVVESVPEPCGDDCACPGVYSRNRNVPPLVCSRPSRGVCSREGACSVSSTASRYRASCESGRCELSPTSAVLDVGPVEASLQALPGQSRPLWMLDPEPRPVSAHACAAADWKPRNFGPLLRAGRNRHVGYSTNIVKGEGERMTDLLGRASPCNDSPAHLASYPNLGRKLNNGVTVALSNIAPAGMSGRNWPGNQCSYQAYLTDGSGYPVTLGKEVIPPFTSIYSVIRKGSAAWIGVQFNGYAKQFPQGGCFVVAVDLCDGHVLWKSNNYTSNGDLVLVGDDYLITGYGFTAEKRIIQVRDAHSGKVLQTLGIPGDPEVMNFNQGLLTVKTNHGEVSFELLR